MNSALVLVLLALTLQQPPIYEFQVDVNRVYVDVFVTRRGEPVPALPPERFEVYDDGARREIELVDVASVPQTFALLIDESGSIAGRKRELLQQAILDFAARLRAQEELALLSFAERTHLRSPLGVERPELEHAAYRIRGGGWTALNDALFLSLNYLESASGRPILVAFTDGMDNASWIDTGAVLDFARFTDAVIYWVKADVGEHFSHFGGSGLVAGGSSGRSVEMLEELTKLTSGRIVEAERMDDISESFQQILSEVSTRYLLVFTPDAEARRGWHELRVKLRGVSDAEVRARAGYYFDP